MSLKNSINFSLWCDFIERDFLENRFQDIVEKNIIQGATSNPAIFASSISNSFAYKQQIDILQANEAKTIYEELALTDIKRAAEILKDLYIEDEDDGFISIEVDPLLCDDAEGTIEEAIRLDKIIGQDNVMIKIPATSSGIIAMNELTKLGININATLVFSPEIAKQCAVAINEGMKIANTNTKAVISVFVSRFDRLCDTQLKSKDLETAKLGIVNATKCYYEIVKLENSNIRTLFASTGVKGDELPASYYIDNLLYTNSVNTAPLETIEQWLEKGSQTPLEQISEDECDDYFRLLESKGIKMEAIYSRLLEDGLGSFKESFTNLLEKLKK